MSTAGSFHWFHEQQQTKPVDHKQDWVTAARIDLSSIAQSERLRSRVERVCVSSPSVRGKVWKVVPVTRL